MTIVVDTNVVVSAAFWPKSEDRRCFVLLARRKCRLAVTGNGQTGDSPSVKGAACFGLNAWPGR